MKKNESRGSPEPRGPAPQTAAEDVCVVEVADELVLSSAAMTEAKLASAIETAARTVLLDLSACEFLDSSGLAVLVRARRRLRPGQRLVLVIPQRIVRRAFEAAGLDSAFEIHPTRAAALTDDPPGGPLASIAPRRSPTGSSRPERREALDPAPPQAGARRGGPRGIVESEPGSVVDLRGFGG